MDLIFKNFKQTQKPLDDFAIVSQDCSQPSLESIFSKDLTFFAKKIFIYVKKNLKYHEINAFIAQS